MTTKIGSRTYPMLAVFASIVVATMVFSAPVAAQGAGSAADREAVRRAVLDYVEGFYEGDTIKLGRSIAPNVFKYGYARREKGYVGSQMRFPDGFFNFARGVREGRNLPPAGAPKEVILFEVQDQTASAKLTAWWGTDYLLLGRQPDGRWRITHVTWQSRPPGSTARQ